MKNKNKSIVLLLLLTAIFIFSLDVVLADWYKGSTHQHTGYSTEVGYDGDFFTFNDNCNQLLEGVPWAVEHGLNVSSLKQNATALNLSWLAFTDHSYCLDEDEFNVVKTDCNTEDAARSNFTCLSGTELSVREHFPEIEPIISTSCANVLFGEAHLGANGINSYVKQSPFGFHCPLSPKAQTGINEITDKEGDGL